MTAPEPAPGDSPIRGAAIVCGLLFGAPTALWGAGLLADGPPSWPAALVIGGPGTCVLAATILFHRRVWVTGTALVVTSGLALVAWTAVCLGTFSGWGD